MTDQDVLLLNPYLNEKSLGLLEIIKNFAHEGGEVPSTKGLETLLR